LGFLAEEVGALKHELNRKTTDIKINNNLVFIKIIPQSNSEAVKTGALEMPN